MEDMEDDRSAKDTAKIRDAALKRALNMPHKPHKPLKKRKAKKARKTSK
jgi:hypothetical protein